MGMSTHIVGFKPPDDAFHKMLAIAQACDVAGVDYPKQVAAFFENDKPDPAGVRVELNRYAAHPSKAVREWNDESGSGYEVDLSLLDPTIKILRFYNSW